LGNEVHVITFSEANAPEESDGVNVHRIKSILNWYKLRFSPRIRELIIDIDPDIVHIQAPAPLTQEYAIINRYKYLATYHNDPLLTDAPPYQISVWAYRKFIFPLFCKRVDRVVCPSMSFQENSRFLRMVPKQKKRTIPNGVDTSIFRLPPKAKTHYRKRLGLSDKWYNQPIGIFVGGMDKLHEYKGVWTLLEALSILADNELGFIFVGDGDLRPAYERRARDLKVSKQVMFLGKIKEEKLIESYWAADFFVLPSTSVECFPIVLLEAMACGLPVIITDLPGPSELINCECDGFRAKPRDPQDLAQKIRKMMSLTDHQLRKMSINSRNRVVEEYDWNKIVKAYLDQYSILLKKQ
jgi:glycosyltransferase involved in cell wall biosynthesis